jgi:hypothetical protein
MLKLCFPVYCPAIKSASLILLVVARKAAVLTTARGANTMPSPLTRKMCEIEAKVNIPGRAGGFRM